MPVPRANCQALEMAYTIDFTTLSEGQLLHNLQVDVCIDISTYASCNTIPSLPGELATICNNVWQ